MAIFRLDIKPVTRSTGRTATAAAAYRAGERIRDERTGAIYNHSKREDVLHKEILLPSKFDPSDARLQWARERSKLWNAAEKTEQRSNSRVAREYQIALPAELSAEQRLALARVFSREVSDRYNVAVDLAIHAPRPEGDPRNFHAHLLATTREVTPEGLGPKTGLDMEGGVRSELGLPPSRQEFVTLRARWAELTNEALREANVQARVDHRSLEAQGIDREPRPQFPTAAIAIERRGERSEAAEGIRARYQERVAARRAKAVEKSAEKSADKTADRTAGLSADSVRSPPKRNVESTLPQEMDARRQQAVRDWLKYRAGPEGTAGAQGGQSPSALSMDEIRRRAVEAWRSLQARGAESPSPGLERGEAETGREAGDTERARDTPGLGGDFSV